MNVTIKFKYTRFKQSGKMYETECTNEVSIKKEYYTKNGFMYYVHEAIRTLHKKIDPDMIWAIGMEDNWFYDIKCQDFSFPVLVGL